jgi:hypothetical protein
MKVCPHCRQPMLQQVLRAGSVTADPAAPRVAWSIATGASSQI